MVYTIFRVMGYQTKKEQTAKITKELLKACLQALAAAEGKAKNDLCREMVKEALAGAWSQRRSRRTVGTPGWRT